MSVLCTAARPCLQGQPAAFVGICCWPASPAAGRWPSSLPRLPYAPAVHLCFICVLHLANEHGLVIKSVPTLDQLLISNVPTNN